MVKKTLKSVAKKVTKQTVKPVVKEIKKEEAVKAIEKMIEVAKPLNYPVTVSQFRNTLGDLTFEQSALVDAEVNKLNREHLRLTQEECEKISALIV